LGLAVLDGWARKRGFSGKKLLLCMGKGSLQTSGMIERVIAPLESTDREIVYCGGIAPEPTLESVEESLKIAREYEVDLVVGVGGGSVLDVAKATCRAVLR